MRAVQVSTQSPSAWAVVNYIKSVILSKLTDSGYRYVIHPSETAAGLTSAGLTFGFEVGDVRRYGAKGDGLTDDTTAISNALLVASQAITGELGSSIYVPNAKYLISSTITLPNRVRIIGQNKRGSYFIAKAGFFGTFMFDATNGTNPIFDSTLENVTVDAANIAGLGCVHSSAWQEGCGLRDVLLINFATYGIKFEHGYGGSSFCLIEGAEIFGGTTAGAIGIDVEAMSLSTAVFNLNVRNVSIAGGSTDLAYGININGENLKCECVHFEVATVGISLAGNGNHELRGVTGATTVTTLVSLFSEFGGSLAMENCFRNGGATLIADSRSAQISQLGAITGGSLYTAGTYNNVPLTGGSGSGATAQIVVAGGAVTGVFMSNRGNGYAVGDTLSAAAANIGGTGSGFSIPVTQTYLGIGTFGGDYAEVRTGPDGCDPNGQSYGWRSAGGLVAWGWFDGTKTGTFQCVSAQGVQQVQRTGAGRYTITLTRSFASVNAFCVTCDSGNVLLNAAANKAGAASFTIAIDNSGTGVATDSAEVSFHVAGF